MSIKLRHIRFEGFKSYDRIATIDFKDDISIVYADNGCGKTSLLKGLYSFLDQNEEQLNILQVKKIICVYVNLENGIIKEVIVNFNEKNNTYDWKNFEKSDLIKLRSLSIAIERGIGSKSLQHIDATDIEYFFDTKHTVSNSLTHLSKPMRRTFSYELFEFLTNRNKLKFNSIKNLDQDFDVDHVYLENFEVKDLEYLILEEYKKSLFERYLNINNVFMDVFNNVVNAHFSEKINGPKDEGETAPLSAEELLLHKERLISILKESENFKNSSKIDLTKKSEIISKLSFKTKFIGVLESIQTENQAEAIVNDFFISSIFKSLLIYIDNNDDILPKFKLLLDTFNSYLIDNKEIVV